MTEGGGAEKSTWPLTDVEIDFYHREGWLVAEGVIPEEDLTELDQVISEIASSALDSEDVPMYVEFEPTASGGRPSVRRILDPYDRHAAFRSVAHSPRIVDRVESLLGSDLDLQHSKLNYKPARVGSPVEWHQDLAYYPHTNDGVLAVLIYLDDATEQNGCLQVLERRHHRYFDHTAPGEPFAGLIVDPTINDVEPRSLPAPAGSAIFLHGLTPHGSLPNESNCDRRTLIFAYRAGDAYPLYYGAVTVEDEAVMRPVRGKRAHHARFGGPPPIVPQVDATSSLYEIQAAERARRDQT